MNSQTAAVQDCGGEWKGNIHPIFSLNEVHSLEELSRENDAAQQGQNHPLSILLNGRDPTEVRR